MDRPIAYVGSVPLVNDFLNTNRNIMIGLGAALQAIIGTATLFDGLACTPTSPGSLQVKVAAGSVYSFGNVDGTAYGNLAADTTHQIVKQGIVLDTTTLSCPAPSTTGNSINYLIQAAFQDQDTDSVVLPYFNAANPPVAFNGPANTGVSQDTRRKGACVISVKAGVSATTGTQVTPAPDAGFTALWVVSVHNGQTAIASGDIAMASGAPFISEKLGDKISIPTGDARYLRGSSTTLRTKLTANTTYYVATTGNDTTGDGSVGLPWLTIQHAVNWIYQNVDSAGFTITISVANGTYTGGVLVQNPLPGGGNLVFTGNTGSPTSCIISTTSADAIVASFDANIQIGGFKVSTTTSGDCVAAHRGSNITIIGAMDFGACAGSHMNSYDTGSQVIVNPGVTYNISGGAMAHMNTVFGGEIVVSVGNTVTGTGAQNFSAAFAQAQHPSAMVVQSLVYSGMGSFTGVRYLVAKNAVIDTAGGGANYFPGNSAGSSATGGQYI